MFSYRFFRILSSFCFVFVFSGFHCNVLFGTSKLSGVNATIIIFVFSLHCIVFALFFVSFIAL